jgi:hypothetical protein
MLAVGIFFFSSYLFALKEIPYLMISGMKAIVAVDISVDGHL